MAQRPCSRSTRRRPATMATSWCSRSTRRVPSPASSSARSQPPEPRLSSQLCERDRRTTSRSCSRAPRSLTNNASAASAIAGRRERRLVDVAALEAVALEQLAEVVAGQAGFLCRARDVAGVALHEHPEVCDLERVDDGLLGLLEAQAGLEQRGIEDRRTLLSRDIDAGHLSGGSLGGLCTRLREIVGHHHA